MPAKKSSSKSSWLCSARRASVATAAASVPSFARLLGCGIGSLSGGRSGESVLSRHATRLYVRRRAVAKALRAGSAFQRHDGHLRPDAEAEAPAEPHTLVYIDIRMVVAVQAGGQPAGLAAERHPAQA